MSNVPDGAREQRRRIVHFGHPDDRRPKTQAFEIGRVSGVLQIDFQRS